MYFTTVLQINTLCSNRKHVSYTPTYSIQETTYNSVSDPCSCTGKMMQPSDHSICLRGLIFPYDWGTN